MPMIWASIKAMPPPSMIIESDWIASSAQLLIITELHKIKEREFLHLILNHRLGVTFMGSATINDLQLHFFSRSVLQWSAHHITIHMLLFWLLSFKGQAGPAPSTASVPCFVLSNKILFIALIGLLPPWWSEHFLMLKGRHMQWFIITNLLMMEMFII